ncbi:glycoside hydrolase family 28 protein [Paraphoma chrysanthemicola]|nr:glycoside hydrolase family 28 protein [Paraphoma chrysanthemicola]
MAVLTHIDENRLPTGLTVDVHFEVQARISGQSEETEWSSITAVTTNAACANITRNEFDTHAIAVASLSLPPGGSLDFRIRYNHTELKAAAIRPASLGIQTVIQDGCVYFALDRAVDVMLEMNNDKWQALHLLVNEVESEDPMEDGDSLWYFGCGVNNGRAYEQVHDGQLVVPSNTTVYLARGAFLTAQVVFTNVENSSIQGPGCIFRPGDTYVASASRRPRELDGGAILIERSNNILVQGVTSLRSFGFSLPIVEGHNVHINHFRSFSGYGNGDGIDLFCCRDVLIENCFLRNSDDTIAIYGHRWDYCGDTLNIQVRNCTLLPDIAHPIQIGTHGNPNKPETFSNIHISGIDILDHCEHQMWYQGCISINAADENLIQDVLVEDIRVEKITKGQLFNIRVMENAMWTTAPGRGVKDVILRNIELDTGRSEVVNPSQIAGYDSSRKVANVTIENLKIGGKYVHEKMDKPRWYMVSDFVPLFANEHVENLVFKLTDAHTQ